MTNNTNSKKHPVYQYVINCIDRDFVNDYDFEKQPQTDAEKLQVIFNIFQSEYGWNVKKIGIYKAYQEWLMGLSCAGIDFENYRILELAKEWGSIPQNATEKQEDKILANWFNFITIKTFALAKTLKVNVNGNK